MVRTMRGAFDAIESGSASRVAKGYAFLVGRVLAGDTVSLDALGSMLTYSQGGTETLRLAAACYEAASRAGHRGATYHLASALIEGAGVPKNIKKGLALLRAARRAGEAAATNYLGYCYRVGEGVTKDARRGFALSLEAAQAGATAAKYDVGMCYLNGTGVAKNPTEAERWIRLAAKDGDRDALEYVRRRRTKKRHSGRHPRTSTRARAQGRQT